MLVSHQDGSKRLHGKLRPATLPASALVLAASGLLLAAGCASPGLPMPPSLKLPDEVKGLAAIRVGDEVDLRWTTPAKTTDGLTLVGPITAEICRDAVPGAQRSQNTACTPVVRLSVSPGVSTAKDTLPAALTSGAPRLLAYRVQLRNASGHTAGPSTAVFTAAGPAPPPPAAFHASTAKAGAVLEWTPEKASKDIIELDRMEVRPPSPTPGMNASNASQTAKKPSEARLRAGGASGDPGGAIDKTAVTGQTYRYTAQRVRNVAIAALPLEIRSTVSNDVTVAMIDVFPPDAPTGLVTSPAFAGNPSADQPQKPAIDLSWEPGTESGIAGYRIYRRDGASGAWTPLSAALIKIPAYRDTTVLAGQPYAYRVTALDQAGNESAPGNEAIETAPTP